MKSLLRHVIVIFPLYMVLAAASDNDYIDLPLMILFALMQGFFMVFWSTGFTIII